MMNMDLGAVTAYALAVKNGFEGTEEEWLASLKGQKGDKGDQGQPGYSDWNAPEGEEGHILGRTHWTEQGFVEILPETTPTYNEDTGFVLADSALPFVVGETYVVNLNGTEYDCVAQDLSALEPGGVGLGDLSLLADLDASLTGNGEPFVVMALGGMTVCMWVDDSTASMTVSVYQESETIHPLDPKYLPDGVPYVETSVAELSVSGGWTMADENEYMFMFSAPIGLEVGNTYKVTWDGVAYECVAQAVDMGGEINTALGNASFADDGEPFLIVEFADALVDALGSYAFASAIDPTVTSAEFSIEGLTTVAHKLPAVCLPESAEPFWVTADLLSKTADHTSTEVGAALKQGRTVVLKDTEGTLYAPCSYYEEGGAACFTLFRLESISNIVTSIPGVLGMALNTDGTIVY